MSKSAPVPKKGKRLFLIWYTCEECGWSLFTQARTYACGMCKGNALRHRSVRATITLVEKH